jgi:hypothetical protein
LTPPTIISVPVQTAGDKYEALGASPDVDVVAQVLFEGLYRPPVFRSALAENPPHTIIVVPVQTAVWAYRACGTPVPEVAVHVFADGLNRLPLLSTTGAPCKALLLPPQMIISVPVHTAVCPNRATGPPGVATQVSDAGEYRAPLL